MARIGMVGAFLDPTDPAMWSGMFRNILGNLEELGISAGYRDVGPPAPLLKIVHRALRATGRLDEGWTLGPEMRALRRLANAAARRKPSGADAWIVPVGALGRPVGGRYVTLSELAPAQFAAMGPEQASAFGLPGLSPRRLAWMVRRQVDAHRHAQACCVVSSWAADALVAAHRIPAARVHVVGCGRNVEIEPPSERDWSTARFLFVGNDWARKNGDGVVRAFARLRDKVPSASLDLVGGHPPIDVDGVTGHGRLSFARATDRPALEALFAGATCFVMPSHLEPFGIVYLEAAAAGVPSIGTTRGGTATSVGDGGILVDPEDEDALVEAMVQMTDPDTAQAYGAAALRRSADFSWRKTTERIVAATGLPGLPDAPPIGGGS